MSHPTPSRRRPSPRGVGRVVLPALAAATLLLASCGSDGSDAGSTTEPKAEVTTTTAAPAEPLKILVSNDDGYSAEGIDALVEGLQTLDDVEITVVAPLAQQSGTGGKTTEGDLKVTDVKLDSGFAAKAVDGFPSDTIRVAFDDLGLEPDLVVTGINEGQNLGPAVDLSGTVGAARAAVARGVPALATSQGLGDPLDYPSAVPFVLDWVKEHREAILAGDEPAAVTNLNVPTCPAGEVRGLADTEADLDGDIAKSLSGTVDCTGTAPAPTGDVDAFLAGFATIGAVPAKAAS